MKTVMISGTTGFLGRLILDELISNNYRVYSLQREINKELSVLYSSDSLIQLKTDFSNLEGLNKQIDLYKTNYFIHLAWDGVSGGNRENFYIQQNNILIFKNIINYVKKSSLEKFITIGSIMELENFYGMFYEKKITNSSYYSISKTMCHAIQLDELQNTGILPIWIYSANLYGETDNSNRFINNTLDKIILKQDLSFTQGNQVYDFLYGRDAAIGIRLVAELGTKKNYYLGSGNPKPLKDFIKDIIQTTSFNGNSTFGKLPFEGVDFPLSFLSIEKLVSDTGFLPKVNFSEGINKVYLSRKRNLNE